MILGKPLLVNETGKGRRDGEKEFLESDSIDGQTAPIAKTGNATSNRIFVLDSSPYIWNSCKRQDCLGDQEEGNDNRR